MKRTCFFLLVMCISLGRTVQAQWRLLYQSKDVVTGNVVSEVADSTSRIQSIESRGSLSKYMVIRFSNHKKVLVLKKAIWGYVDGNNKLWRSYDKELFLVTRYMGGWVEYEANRLTMGGRPYMQPMYSRTLDSRISPIWLQAMNDVPAYFIVR